MAVSSKRLFEWSVLGMAVALILALAAEYYGRLAGEVQRLSVELAARHFETAVSGVRAQWYVERSRDPASDVVLFSELAVAGERPGEEGVRVYLNPAGWPVTTRSRAAARERLSTAHCTELWRAFLQEPPALYRPDDEQAPASHYRVTLVAKGNERGCRYRRIIDDKKSQYFDYWPTTGRVSGDWSRK